MIVWWCFLYWALFSTGFIPNIYNEIKSFVGSNTFILIIYVFIFIGIYFIPAIVASFREHHSSLAIFFLNAFLGWTSIGWVAALVWSGTSIKSSEQGDLTKKNN